jgi:hypothetical protein
MRSKLHAQPLRRPQHGFAVSTNDSYINDRSRTIDIFDPAADIMQLEPRF